ncbi:hypothetical protein [Lapillicoccus sp.]|uniref:hypothetical protein n=1 Tax=Lapillicoccus sp. TaxID=1909287 RepID=UPI0025E838F8|nr:hypothetical protein [Lapillicoccus sp.]
MGKWATVVAVAVPGVLLAGVGLLHPTDLDPATAHTWRTLHVWLIPVFPLLGAAVWLLLRGEKGVFAQLARLGAYGFATFYTALDVLAGIGAGLAMEQEGASSPVVGRLFDVGNRLGAIGVWCLLAAALLGGAVLVRRDGPRALLGTVVFAGSCYPFLQNHIFHPRGVLAVLGIALGLALLAAARSASASAPGRGAIDAALRAR